MPPPPDAARAGDWSLYPVAFLVGLAVGSFLNVCIHRLPREESVMWPGSRCPRCAAPIAWYDNVPLLSWLWLRARCRSCGAPISARYPLIEAATGTLAVLALARLGPTPWGGVAFAFTAALLLVSIVDLDHLIIPDVVSLPGILVGLAASALLPGGTSLWDALAGVCLGGGMLWIVAASYERATGVEGLGLGDAKLLAMIRAFLGWQAVPAGRVGGAGEPRRSRGGPEGAAGARHERRRRPLEARRAQDRHPVRPVPGTGRRGCALRSGSHAAVDVGASRLTFNGFSHGNPPARGGPDDSHAGRQLARAARLSRAAGHDRRDGSTPATGRHGCRPA